MSGISLISEHMAKVLANKNVFRDTNMGVGGDRGGDTVL